MGSGGPLPRSPPGHRDRGTVALPGSSKLQVSLSPTVSAAGRAVGPGPVGPIQSPGPSQGSQCCLAGDRRGRRGPGPGRSPTAPAGGHRHCGHGISLPELKMSTNFKMPFKSSVQM